MSAKHRSRLLTAGLLGGALAAAALACGDDTPEQRLEQASERLAEAREDVRELRGDLGERREREDEASQALQEARASLRGAEQDVLSAEQLVEQRATDVALFRTLQSAMLESSELDHSAVEVRVADGVVTLAGVAADESARQRALEIARGTPGVESVRDQLEVERNTARAEASATR
jgi:osmotically-inducible protein OsmY